MIVGDLDVNIITNPKDIVEVWPLIRIGILAANKHNSGYNYMPEDVYHEIKLGKATLITANNLQGDYEGFIIVKDHPYPDGMGMYFWIMHHYGKQKRFLFDFFSALRAITKQAGIFRCATAGARKGWDRRIEKFGLKKIGTINYYEDK